MRVPVRLYPIWHRRRSRVQRLVRLLLRLHRAPGSPFRQLLLSSLQALSGSIERPLHDGDLRGLHRAHLLQTPRSFQPPLVKADDLLPRHRQGCSVAFDLRQPGAGIGQIPAGLVHRLAGVTEPVRVIPDPPDFALAASHGLPQLRDRRLPIPLGQGQASTRFRQLASRPGQLPFALLHLPLQPPGAFPIRPVSATESRYDSVLPVRLPESFWRVW